MTKKDKYEQFIKNTTLLISDEHDEISVLANVVAAIKEEFNFFWAGFYLVKGKKELRSNAINELIFQLVLGPFQGSPACYRIGYNKGVCGTAWKEKKSIIVPDVENFPGHIACSSLSRSEIVIPIYNKEYKVVAVLDIDSDQLNTFDDIDRQYLEQLCQIITNNLY